MKTLFTLLLLIVLSELAFGQSAVDTRNQTIYQSGLGFGSVIAVVAPWDRNKSILWAMLHGIFGWFYVIYFALTRDSHDKQTPERS